MAGEDTTVIQFEVSGNNSVHSFVGENGPQFFYTTTDMASHLASFVYGTDTLKKKKRFKRKKKIRKKMVFWGIADSKPFSFISFSFP